MKISEAFPPWDKLTDGDREKLERTAVSRSVPAGTLIYGGEQDCLGLIVVRSGQLRAYILSDEGREITIYRLFEMDVCLLSASCMLNNIQFDIAVEAEKDSTFWVIPPNVYREIMEHSAPLANYTNELMSGRFSEVMWLVEQIMWKSLDSRVAEFLLSESAIEQSTLLHLTHEKIANHLGTAREVVTRMLRYFQSEGLVKLSRGTVELTDPARLTKDFARR